MVECLRVLKPGGHALVWALPRTSHWTATAIEDAGFEIRDVVLHLFGTGFPKSRGMAGGRGTSLKPAAEHWILCRKPLAGGGVVANVLAHGTGALNVDECRTDGAARWPANVTLDDEAAVMLDAQSGARRSAGHYLSTSTARKGVTSFRAKQGRQYADTGGASRFFYVAKGSKSEKTAGGTINNTHPTAKSIALMRWLVRLITPPGGVVLDCFAGSGTTGVAALAEGRRFIGLELSLEYAEVARKRLSGSASETA
jgi:hypothetical protein